jgi:hypothetical protein
MISTNEIEKYLKEWEEAPLGRCHDGDWHLEWRKLPHGSQCFKYIGNGVPSIISLSEKYDSNVGEYFIVWDFRSKSGGSIYRIPVMKKALYLSPFTGKLH